VAGVAVVVGAGVWHTASAVAEHGAASVAPDAQAVHALHTRSVDAVGAALWYSPRAQLGVILAHTVGEYAVHAPAAYCPAPQAPHEEHERSTVGDPSDTWNSPALQTVRSRQDVSALAVHACVCTISPEHVLQNPQSASEVLVPARRRYCPLLLHVRCGVHTVSVDP
jgi:hypothetical protein